jgi:ribose/xylose/arabinose/galactoside ABC-type transport system permease subunit
MIFLATVMVGFGVASARFLTFANLSAILSQSSWLIVVASGMNLVLLTGGVDLSVGAAMYLAVVVVGVGFATRPVAVCLAAAVAIGGVFGALNGLLISRLRLPPFIVTLAILFIGRGAGLYLSSTRIVFAGSGVSEFGRERLASVPAPLWLAASATLVCWLMVHAMPLGPYIRSLGADREGAVRAGVRVGAVTWGTFALCGAFAGLGGFISFSQTSSASGAFGQNAEFLAIAAAVLGGTSLFGGRGTLSAAVVGAVLITTVQNGLVMINANPYAYPVFIGLVIFVAALIDSMRLRTLGRLERYRLVS